MPVQLKIIQNEIGLRLGEQGPRQAVGDQAAGEKLTTGINHTQNKIKLGKGKPWRKKQQNPDHRRSKCSLKILQLNICGIRNKKLELAKLLNTHKIHVVFLQETLHKGIDLYLSGYTSYACKCTNCRGIVTYIRNDTQGHVTQLTAHPTDVQKVTIWHTGGKYTLYNVYSPPQTTCNLTELQETQYHKTILAGDFNGHSPHWGYPDRNRTGRLLEELTETTNLSVLQNAESTPTLLHRVHLSLSRPDLTICSSDLIDSCHLQVLDGIGSDHKPILTTISTPSKAYHKRKTHWNFGKADWRLFQESSDYLFSNIDSSSIEIFANEVNRVILNAASQSIPKGNRKFYKPFFNKEMQAAISERNKARTALETAPSQEARICYNKACAKAKLAVKKAKNEKWSSTCGKLDLRYNGKRAWTLIENLSGSRRRENPKPMIDGRQTITEDQKKAEHFNRYFASVNRAGKLSEADRERLKHLKHQEKVQTASTTIFEADFNMQELKQGLRKLKPRKAPGPDKIYNEMLTHLSPLGKETVLKLINMTWRNGQIPKDWRNAYITPILKSNKSSDEPKSYRPISLTSCLGKLAERMVNARLYWFLESSNILCHEQAGFRKGSCTEDQLFRLTQRIHDGFQNNKHTVAIFFDLQQAYDRVWRKGLLMKMIDVGIRGKLYNWIKYFLIDRTIQTKLNDAVSSKEVLEEGLPQGSALSCTLFLIYINDLTKHIKAEKALYADDLTIWQSHENAEMAAQKLNGDLRRLHEYCQTWKLKVNCEKTVYTIFTKSHKVAKKNISLVLDNKKLPREEQPTYLGVTLDRQLNLKKHVENIRNKALKRLQLLKRLTGTTWGSDKDTLRGLYLGYVRSALEYNSALLTTCAKTNVKSLDRVQNNALRLISGGMRSTPSSACEIHTNVEPLEMRRDMAAMEVYERNKRMNKHHPNKQLVDNWKQKQRLKQKSVLHHVSEIKDRYHLPDQRQELQRVARNLPPHTYPKMPEIETKLKENATKSSDPVSLMRASQRTIEAYPDEWIHVYTDGSAFKATVKAGYGVYIQYPNGTSDKLFDACGEICSNYEAEITALEAALYHLKTVFDVFPSRAQHIVIFTDSLSALKALKGDFCKPELTQIITDANQLITSHQVRIVMQWIPGHSNTPGNDVADKLAKTGSKQEQPQTPTTLQTAKKILKTANKETWMNRWAMGNTGREVYKYMACPNPKDNISLLERRDQSTIFRLRTQHIQLNDHLSRILPQHTPECRMCTHPKETVKHHLFECPALENLRTMLLPPRPDKWNTLYGTKQQLINTCRYHHMALSQRAGAQRLLDQ